MKGKSRPLKEKARLAAVLSAPEGRGQAYRLRRAGEEGETAAARRGRARGERAAAPGRQQSRSRGPERAVEPPRFSATGGKAVRRENGTDGRDPAGAEGTGPTLSGRRAPWARRRVS